MTNLIEVWKTAENTWDAEIGLLVLADRESEDWLVRWTATRTAGVKFMAARAAWLRAGGRPVTRPDRLDHVDAWHHWLAQHAD